MIFNRYWISDSSGSGREKWQYFEGDYEDDYEWAREDILFYHESWAHHASYSLHIELNIPPTKELIMNKIKQLSVRKRDIEAAIEELSNQLLDLLDPQDEP